MGLKRIEHLSDNGTVQTTVTFAANEHSVTPHGFAPTGARVTTTDGSAGTVRLNTTTHLFSVDVSPGADHNAAVTLTANRGGRTVAGQGRRG